MKKKVGMQSPPLLLALLLVSAMMIPAVAAEGVQQSGSIEQSVLQYDAEKYTVRLVASEIPQEMISTRTQATMRSFEAEFKNIPPRFVGTAEIDISEDEKVVAYVFRVLPSGESLSYAEVVSSKDDPSLEEMAARVDAWITGPLEIKTAESLKECNYGLLSYGPAPIHTATISRTYTGIGRAYLTTT